MMILSFTLITIEDGSQVFKVDLEKLSSVSNQPLW